MKWNLDPQGNVRILADEGYSCLEAVRTNTVIDLPGF